MIISRHTELIAQLKTEMQENADLVAFGDEELRRLVTAALAREIEKRRSESAQFGFPTFREKQAIITAVFDSIRGLGVLEQIISDPEITEVMINGYSDIFIERGGKLTKLECSFESSRELEIIIAKFVSGAGRQVNESEPIVDTRLEDGSRVNVVMPPIALNGPIVTIRRFPKEAMTVRKLIEYGSITKEVADVLATLVRCKYNIFVSGGTGSGKTTFLNALSNFIPKDERIITIEDSAELQIMNVENIVRLETRNAGGDGGGAVTIRDLIRAALRMRPERIIVGEVRGGEALDMLQAMNTGHDGSLSTGHANSTHDMLSRIETMVLQGADGLPLEAIRQQIGSAIDIIIHLSRMRDKSRKTVQISEVTGYDPVSRTILVNPLYEFIEIPDKNNSAKVTGELKRTANPMVNTQKLRAAGMGADI